MVSLFEVYFQFLGKVKLLWIFIGWWLEMQAYICNVIIHRWDIHLSLCWYGCPWHWQVEDIKGKVSNTDHISLVFPYLLPSWSSFYLLFRIKLSKIVSKWHGFVIFSVLRHPSVSLVSSSCSCYLDGLHLFSLYPFCQITWVEVLRECQSRSSTR